ncbi:calcium/sodium antiporter [Wenyingzhuangia sp. IMCC45574]
MFLVFIITGLIILVLGGDWLLKAAVNISVKLNIPRIVIGMTVVSFATSAPELIVSIRSALDGFSDISLGNVIGSNIANIALVLGLTVCLSKINIDKTFYKLDWPLMIVSSLLLYFFIVFDHQISRTEGIILFIVLIVSLLYLLKFHQKNKNNAIEEDEDIPNLSIPVYKILFFLIIGAIGLWAGSELLIKGATGLAKELGISERIIAVTIVSIGTSIPELAASIIAIIKKEKAISLGNLIGSNIFNILAVMGITAIIKPIHVNDIKIVNNDIYWMLGIAFIILPLCFFPKKMQFGLKEGLLLLASYIAFVYFTIF